MILREFRLEDLEAIRSLHERSSDFPFPNLNHPLYVAKNVVENDGKVIATGLIRLTSEAILILDLDLSRSARAEVVTALIREAGFKCQKLGIDEIHAFLTGEITYSFSNVLKRKFGFVDCEGIPLVLQL